MAAGNYMNNQTQPVMPELSLSEMVRLIANSTAEHKQNAMDIVMLVGLKVSLPILEDAVRNDADADLRNGAMEALVAFGEMAVPHLTRLLTDENEEVRNFSAVMLGDIGNAKAVEPLINALQDPDANVRHGAAEALGKIGDLRAVTPLQNMGTGDMWDQFYSSSALEMLANTGKPPAGS